MELENTSLENKTQVSGINAKISSFVHPFLKNLDFVLFIRLLILNVLLYHRFACDKS